MKLPLLSIAALLLTGCALGPQAPVEADAKARLFQPVPDKAVVYLLRDHGDIFVQEVTVSVDGKDMGSTWPGSYFRWELEPGTHVLVSQTAPPAVLKLRTDPGGVYYVWQDINVGFLRKHTALRVVDATTARWTLDSAYLLKSNP